jgi:macrolide-specific efflux system membrane fusion protein
VQFVFRDDHVGREDERLYALLDVFAAHRMPIDLGVNPELLSESLARNLRARLDAADSGLALHEHRLSQSDTKVSRNATARLVVAGRDPTKENLGRRLAVAASRRQPVEVVLNHVVNTREELSAIDELLVLLANHRNAECVLLSELTEPFREGHARQDMAVGAPLPAPGKSTSLTPWRRDPDVQSRGIVGWLSLAAGIAVIGALGWHWFAGARPPADALTAPVLRGHIEDSVLAAGTLQPFAYVDVGAQTSGQLKSVHVKLGERVTKGQLLAEIDPLISASRVSEARATLANLEAQWEGKRAEFELARQQRARSVEMLRNGTLAASEAEIADSKYALAQSALRALDAQMKQARAALETAQANLAFTRITAPMSGEVVAINALEGQTLNAAQQTPTILRIAELDTMTVWALVPEADVSHLAIGQDVYFTVLGQGERRWQGLLRQILPSPEIIGNVVFYNALFDIPNPRRELKVQMTAQVFFVRAQADDALYVPLSAIGDLRPGHAGLYTVQVLKDDGHIKARPVRVGIMNAISAQIVSGLDAGENVIIGTAKPSTELAPQTNKINPLHKAKLR